MNRKNNKILVVATSRKTRGGITSVVKTHEKGEHWKKYHCKWIETHIDRGIILKIFYFIKSYIQFISIAPFYDIIHIHVASYPSLRRKYLYFIVAKIYRKKIISHFHPPSSEVIFKKENKFLYKKMFKGSSKVVVLSPQWKIWLQEALDITKNVEVIYNPGFQLDFTTKRHLFKKYILFAGTVIERKGYVDLIKSFSKIANKHVDWSVIIAGNGEIGKGKRLVKDLGIESQVSFVGWVAGDIKKQLFADASIFCLPSYSEGFPMSVIDAWSYGLPVVCTLAGGLGDIVKEGENALIFDYGDIDQLAAQLERLIENDELRKKISEESKKLILTTFNSNNINKRLVKLYEDILSD